jgi:DNA-binding response OmpR family regulator
VDCVSGPVLLLVEDDEMVRLVTADLLAEMGYAVREAGSAEAALAALDGTVELLITDVRLPDADGRDLARKARERVPSIAVVVASGEVGEEDGAVWLMKPYGAEELRAALAKVSDQ